MTHGERCLWHAADGRCANCKAKRIRLDVLEMEDYGLCRGPVDYETCGFHVPRPEVPEVAP